ncbi:D-alanine--D-alanine ligase [Candidatus Omnitrophota bacterium]
MKKRVGVLMGGPSCERDISIRSGKAVCHALENKGMEVVPIELAASSSVNGYEKLVKKKLSSSDIEVAFIALHGKFGEDGEIQKILEDMKIPYTGSRSDASRLGMDKISSKDIFESNNIPMPPYRVVLRSQRTLLDHPSSDDNVTLYFRELGSPLAIKPSNEGSSIGLSIVAGLEDFYRAIKSAYRFSERVIVEQYVRGREITVGILEDKPLPSVEIIPSRRFFDFKAKYEKGSTEYMVPAKISKEQDEECRKIALLAHRALGAHFFSRVDMILTEEGAPLVLEVNTIPGLTEMSLLPKAAQAAGIDFNQLVFKILESAL